MIHFLTVRRFRAVFEVILLCVHFVCVNLAII